MRLSKCLECPKCRGNNFTVKRVATYLYNYKIDTECTDSQSDHEEALPFLFDYREQLDDKEYLECMDCGAKFPFDLENGDPKIHLTILQKAIRSDFQNNPDYLG